MISSSKASSSTPPVTRLASVRRWLAFLLLSLWFGGFTFYAAVVVPTGSDILGRTEQGFVTQRVTGWLNVIGAVMILAVSWEMGYQITWRKNKLATFALTIFSGALAVLAVLHGYLGHQLSADTMTVENPGSFYQLHRIYLWLSSVQWLACLGLWWSLARPPIARSS